MRTIPFTEKTEEKKPIEQIKESMEKIIDKEVSERTESALKATQPATGNLQPATALQKYGWLIIVALLLGAAWFFNKYKLVPKIVIPAV